MPQRPRNITRLSSTKLRGVGVFLLLFCGVLSGVARQKIISLELPSMAAAFVDRPGDLYVLQKDNTLKKFDIQGKLLSEKKFQEPLTYFEPRDGARMFAYHRTTQQCAFFSDETRQEFNIEQQYAIDPFLVCASGDHNVWILDAEDFSLKKVNPAQSKVLAESSIQVNQFKQSPVFLTMREYQGFLFLHEQTTGLLIFNSLGIQIKKIENPKIEYFNFLGEELYYKTKDKLYFFDLFDSNAREETVDADCKYVLLTDARRFLVYENRLDILEIKE
jgi:hypothetical protein